MSSSAIRKLIAVVFIGLGGWCLLFPGNVIAMTINPAYLIEGRLVEVLMGAFGAQAVLFGVVALVSRFTPKTYLVFGLAVLPFFAFDYWFYVVEPVFNAMILLDALGNVILIALCVLGYRAPPEA